MGDSDLGLRPGARRQYPPVGQMSGLGASDQGVHMQSMRCFLSLCLRVLEGLINSLVHWI
jgi:hypothetical protein